jgi:hypothetical protein
MKFKFDIECTPEEARQFVGLPSVAGMQDRMMKEVEAKMQDNIRNLDPETFVKTWLPATMAGWGEMQKMFWGQMGMNMAENDPGKKK